MSLLTRLTKKLKTRLDENGMATARMLARDCYPDLGELQVKKCLSIAELKPGCRLLTSFAYRTVDAVRLLDEYRKVLNCFCLGRRWRKRLAKAKGKRSDA